METNETAALRGELAALKAVMPLLMHHLQGDRIQLANLAKVNLDMALKRLDDEMQDHESAALKAFGDTARAIQRGIANGRYR